MGPQVAAKTALLPSSAGSLSTQHAPREARGPRMRFQLTQTRRGDPWSCCPALGMHLPRITEMSGEAALTGSQVQPDTGVFFHQPGRKHVG